MIKGVTARHAPETQQNAAKTAMTDDCLTGILRTARLKPAAGRLQYAQPAPVKTNQPKQNFLKNIHGPADSCLRFPELQSPGHLPDFGKHFRHFCIAHFTAWNEQHPDGRELFVNLVKDFAENAPGAVSTHSQTIIPA